MALAQAGGYSSDLTPSLGKSICHGHGPRNGQKTKDKKKEKKYTQNPASVYNCASLIGKLAFVLLKMENINAEPFRSTPHLTDMRSKVQSKKMIADVDITYKYQS